MRQIAPLLIFLLTSVAFAQDKTFSSGLMFSANTKVEKVWTGGEFTEGPAYGKDHCVYFSDIGNRIMKFDPATNDKWLNKHCLEHMFTWRANTDASFVTSALGILFYITKYVVKAEPKSNALKMINENVIKRMSATDT